MPWYLVIWLRALMFLDYLGRGTVTFIVGALTGAAITHLFHIL